MNDTQSQTLPVVSLPHFETSDSIVKIVEALSKAQGKMKPAVMDSTNPHYKSKYASLSSVKSSYQEPNSEQGLALTHQVFSFGGQYHLRTMLAHISGEFMATTIELLVGKRDMQGLGSAITYGKRYNVSALLDIVTDEDDDGNGSLPPSGNNNNQNRNQNQNKNQGSPRAQSFPQGLTDAQIKRLYAIGSAQGWPSVCVRVACMARNSCTPSKMSKKQYDDLCNELQNTQFNSVVQQDLDAVFADFTMEQRNLVDPKPQDPTPPPFDQGEEMPTFEDDTPPSMTPLEILYTLVKEKNLDSDRVKEIIKKCTGAVKKSTELNTKELDAVINYIQISK